MNRAVNMLGTDWSVSLTDTQVGVREAAVAYCVGGTEIQGLLAERLYKKKKKKRYTTSTPCHSWPSILLQVRKITIPFK